MDWKTGHSASQTLTVTNDVYTIGDAVGGLITFAGAVRIPGGTSLLKSVKLRGVSALVYELWFFNADLTTTVLDNGAMTLIAADENKFLGWVAIAAADYKAAASAFNCAAVKNIDLMVQAASTTTNIYAYLKATATTTPGTDTLYITADFIYKN